MGIGQNSAGERMFLCLETQKHTGHIYLVGIRLTQGNGKKKMNNNHNKKIDHSESARRNLRNDFFS